MAETKNLDTPETYECAMCGEVFAFTQDWSQEDAVEEYEKNFPKEASESVEVGIVCDDCYDALMEMIDGAELEDIEDE